MLTLPEVLGKNKIGELKFQTYSILLVNWLSI